MDKTETKATVNGRDGYIAVGNGDVDQANEELMYDENIHHKVRALFII